MIQILRNEPVRNSRTNPPSVGGFALGGGSSMFFNAPNIISESTPPIIVPQIENNSQDTNNNNNDENIIDKSVITPESTKWASSLFSDMKVSKNSDNDIIVIIMDNKAKTDLNKNKNFVEFSEISLQDESNKDRIVRTGITENGEIVSEIVISSTSTVLFSLVTTIDTIIELEDVFNKDKKNSQFSIKSFNFQSIGIYFSVAGIYKDTTEVREPVKDNRSYAPFSYKPKEADVLFNPPTPEYCVSHDYKCTYPGSDKIHVPLIWCSFDVDLSGCCKQHDTDLWCGAGLPSTVIDGPYLAEFYYAWYTTVNAKFAACVTAAFINSASNLPWYCGGFAGGFLIGLATGMIAGYVHFIGVQFGGLINLAQMDKYMPWGSKNKSSCLCGGKVSTSLCNEKCRDLCLERNKKETCTDCKWICINKQAVLSPHPNDIGRCCAKTRPVCLPKIPCN
ncbi:MAG: hypothetical protein HYZ54_05370 [Ignavibacteriae bacterium]|nr:hypothetical protein [Ignavibacteriota bacterium]